MDIGVRVDNCGTLKLIRNKRVGESIRLDNRTLKKVLPNIRLRLARDLRSRPFETGV